MSKPYVTVRYEESEGTFILGWYEYDISTPDYFVVPAVLRHFLRQRRLGKFRTPVEDRPDWLSRIINLGLVGGFGIRAQSPPYDLALWFCLDKQGELVSFINFED